MKKLCEISEVIMDNISLFVVIIIVILCIYYFAYVQVVYILLMCILLMKCQETVPLFQVLYIRILISSSKQHCQECFINIIILQEIKQRHRVVK